MNDDKTYEERLAMLKALAGTMSLQSLAAAMDQTEKSIRNMAYHAGVSIAFSNKPWTTEEEQKLMDLRKERMPYRKIARILGRADTACMERHCVILKRQRESK